MGAAKIGNTDSDDKDEDPGQWPSAGVVAKAAQNVVEKVNDSFPDLVKAWKDGTFCQETLQRLRSFKVGGTETHPGALLDKVIQLYREEKSVPPFDISESRAIRSQSKKQTAANALWKDTENWKDVCSKLNAISGTTTKDHITKIFWNFIGEVLTAISNLFLRLLELEDKLMPKDTGEYMRQRDAVVGKYKQ